MADVTVLSHELTYAETKLRHFTNNSFFAEQDNTIPYRIVGTYEYLNAIDSLTRLAESSTTEEIAVYDKLISEKPEFSFKSGATVNPLEIQAVPATPAEVAANEDNQAAAEPPDPAVDGDPDSRHSLAWMLALARIEIGSTVSMYGTTEGPYAEFGSQTFGLDEYAILMIDDAASHIKILSEDNYFFDVLARKTEVGSDTLAYLRRIKVVDDMIYALRSLGNRQLNTAMEPYSSELDAYRDRLVEKVRIATASFTQTSGATTIESTQLNEEILNLRFQNRENLRSCQRMSEAMYNRGRPGNTGGQ
ncbi:MAG: hypothetical protein AAF456_15945 [Planctomycetota bacterium]